MKPFWGIDLTNDKRNTQHNGRDFLSATPSPALTQSLESASTKAAEQIKASQLPVALRITQTAAGVICALIGFGIVKGLGEVTIDQAYYNAPALFWVAGGCFVLWAILKLLGSRKAKQVLDTEAQRLLVRNLQASQANIYAELGLPNDAPQVDVLAMSYKIKGNQLKPCVSGTQYTAYHNKAFRCYTDEENLYLVNLSGKYAFPLSELTALRTVNKKISFSGWHKNNSPTSQAFKPYKLAVNQYGAVFCKPYYILELTHNSETWGIYLPSYEASVIERLTGLKAQ